MDAIQHLKLRMLARVEGFLEANPIGERAADAVVGEFMARLARMRALGQQQLEGAGHQKASTARHRELRQLMIAEPLRHLARIGQSLRGEDDVLAAKLCRPAKDLSYQEFIALVRSTVDTAREHQDLLRGRGMAEGLIDDLSARLVMYTEVLSDSNADRRAHTGARAELRLLGPRLMQMVRQLDGIVLYQFRQRPELLGAWKSARVIGWPARATRLEQPAA